jgi:hypothetical protein
LTLRERIALFIRVRLHVSPRAGLRPDLGRERTEDAGVVPRDARRGGECDERARARREQRGNSRAFCASARRRDCLREERVQRGQHEHERRTSGGVWRIGAPSLFRHDHLRMLGYLPAQLYSVLASGGNALA